MRLFDITYDADLKAVFFQKKDDNTTLSTRVEQSNGYISISEITENVSTMQTNYRLHLDIIENGKVRASQSSEPTNTYKVQYISGLGSYFHSGICNFEISSMINKRKQGLFTFPDEEANKMIAQPLISEFRVLCYNTYGTIPVEENSAIETIYSLPVKLSESEQAGLNENNKSLLDYLTESQMFLSDHTEKYTDKHSPERLYLFVKTASKYALYVKKYYSDNTTENETLLVVDHTGVYGVYECKTGYLSVVNAATDGNRLITKWEIYASAVGIGYNVQITKAFTYYLDFNTYQWARYFLYKNKYGAYETFRTTGLLTLKHTGEKQIATTMLPKGFTHSTFKRNQVSNTVTRLYNLNTGYLNESQRGYLAEFVDSDEVYLLKNGNKYAVNINNPEIELYTDREPLKSNDIIVEGALDDNILSPRPQYPLLESPDFNIDFNEDYFV
jgi:hypothetical protein